jgi:hypothetical protein
MYRLSQKESEDSEYYRKALQAAFHGTDILSTTYCFTGDGLGTTVEVEYTILDPDTRTRRTFRYNVTDYDSW